MADFLEVIESMRSEEASVEKLFGGEGTAVRRGRKSTDYQRRLSEAAKFVADLYEGRKPMYMLREAMTTSDFPYLFGDIIDRQVLANYQETPQIWSMVAKRETVADFRNVNRFAINGAEAVLTAVPEQDSYKMRKVSDAKYTYAVSKYGARVPFSWEAMINDDLQALQDIPQRLGKAARRSEEKFVTQLHVDSNGPHASFYTSGNKNIINATNAGSSYTAVNPPLSIAAIQQAFAVLANMVDNDGEPISITGVTLEVPPGLEVVAQNILHATTLYINPNSSAGTADQRLFTENWLRSKITLAVNLYLPIVATTNGQTSWFLHANPNLGRPAFLMGFLRGHDTPELFMKMPNAQRVGGGAMDPLNGDFETDSIEYKLRHVFGGTTADPKMSVASNGSGA